MDTRTIIAANRFGFGRRPGDPVPADPRTWLHAQLEASDPTPSQGTTDTSTALGLVFERREEKQAAKQAMKQADAPAMHDGQGAAARPGMGKGGMDKAGMNKAGMDKGSDEKAPNPVREMSRREIRAFFANALVTPAPFRERLVWFWANHFTIAAKEQVAAACAGAYVREAIRPHVTGRFSDMLLAVMHHPAMLGYLNQERSTGPDSPAGQRRHGGLNENLARECLELHTVTPASGYTQQDVTNFARILTGWSYQMRDEPRGYQFRQAMHEPGSFEVMGRTWPEGEQGGVAVLGWLGTHPATYRHLADKLVRHFSADEPQPADVHRIETVLRDTQGDLGAASAALVDLPSAWVPGTKLRTPQEYTIACLRAVDATPDTVPNLLQIAGGLGQGVFQAPFPIGWPDRAADWAGPEAMLERVDYAYGLAGHVANQTDPEQLGHAVLGPMLTADTLGQIRSAGSRRDGLTLLFSSPEFQRR